jgi:hypothetical protein
MRFWASVVFVIAVVGVLGVWAGIAGLRKEERYHDKLYKECVEDGKQPYYCDSLAWQAAHARYNP